MHFCENQHVFNYIVPIMQCGLGKTVRSWSYLTLLLRKQNVYYHSWSCLNKIHVGALQSLTGKVQVFLEGSPCVLILTLTCFGSVQGLKGQISLKYREIYTFWTGISILHLHSCLCIYNRDFPALWKTATWNFAKTGKTL